MRTGRFTSFFILLASATFLFSGIAQAGWFKKTPEERAQRMVEKVTDELDLSAEQQIQLKEYVTEVMAFAKENRPERGSMMDLAIEQVQSGKIDQSRVKEEIDTHRQRIEAIATKALERADQFLQTLTPEQRGKLVEHLQEMKERFAEGGHHRGFWH
ncbi:MAG: Spy/CpxP family protein refolding chaperone [bacterium]|nr:Spy/CpxP family protein refolding chaperone [bacterium]